MIMTIRPLTQKRVEGLPFTLPLAFRFEGVDRAGLGNDLHCEQERSVLDCAAPRLDSFVSDRVERRCFRWQVGDGSERPRATARDPEIAFRVLLLVESNLKARSYCIRDGSPAILFGEVILLRQLGRAWSDGA